MDNEGAYITYQGLLLQLFPSTFVSYKSKLTLSNKTVNTFDHADHTFAPAVNDIVTQGVYAQRVAAIPSATKVELEDATNFENGDAMIFRSTKTIEELTILRSFAMQRVDLWTGQWFNKRTLSPVNIEGNNTPMFHFCVPIIEITSFILNSEIELITDEYKVFDSRTLPDDRRNPKIMLVTGGTSIFENSHTTRFFVKGYTSVLEGSWGFLEEDGSTPDAIRWLTGRWAARQLTLDRNPLESSAQQKKKEKTDLHEIEWDTVEETAGAQIQTRMSGDPEMDRIIQMYKAPIAMGGTMPSVPRPYVSVKA